MDMVLSVKNIPQPGETILSDGFSKIPGGKGANQAVAARRLGANVYLIANIGQDDNGQYLLNCLKNDKVNTEFVFADQSQPTGIAVIAVEQKGNNSIIVVPGANMNIKKEQIYSAYNIIKNSDIIVAQFETPLDMTIEAFKIAKENGVTTVLNPAPARDIPHELLKLTDIIVPNETETFIITGIDVDDSQSIKAAADRLIKSGVKYVIITLGSRGAAVVSSTDTDLIPAYKVQAVDTTAAGDAFIGALCYTLSLEEDINYFKIRDAVRFGNKVSSIAVQTKGAQSSLPYINEVLDAYGEDKQ